MDSPYDLVFNSLKSDKKNSIIQVDILFFNLLMRLFLNSVSNNNFFKFWNLNNESLNKIFIEYLNTLSSLELY